MGEVIGRVEQVKILKKIYCIEIQSLDLAREPSWTESLTPEDPQIGMYRKIPLPVITGGEHRHKAFG